MMVLKSSVFRYAMCLEYDGSAFHGWQTQKGVATVQEALETAVSKVANESTRIVTAGRTDAGVHATGQIVHYDTTSQRPIKSWLRGANTHLPRSIAVLWVSPVAATFHARYSATARAYRYVLLNRKVRPTYLASRVAWDHRLLDVELMRVAADHLKGKHDFNAYRAVSCQAKTAIRVIHQLDVSRNGDWIWFDIQANGFLQHMVRNIVGVLSTIGAKEAPPDWAQEVLETRDRRLGGVTAVPDGLYLRSVSYPEDYDFPSAPPACRFW